LASAKIPVALAAVAIGAPIARPTAHAPSVVPAMDVLDVQRMYKGCTNIDP